MSYVTYGAIRHYTPFLLTFHCDRVCVKWFHIFFCSCDAPCAVTKYRCVSLVRSLALWCLCRMILRHLSKFELTTTCSTSKFIGENVNKVLNTVCTGQACYQDLLLYDHDPGLQDHVQDQNLNLKLQTKLQCSRPRLEHSEQRPSLKKPRVPCYEKSKPFKTGQIFAVNYCKALIFWTEV